MAFSSTGCMFFGVCSMLLILCAPLFSVLNVLSASGSQVKVSVEELFVPAILNNSASDYSFTNSTSVFFILSLYDDTYDMGIVYDNITVKFYYVGTSIANYTWLGFYQTGDQGDSTIELSDYVETREILFAEVSKNVSEIILRVNLVTAVRFKYWWWESKTHGLSVQGDVKVSTMTGKKIVPKGIKLSPQHSGGHYKAFINFSFCFYIFLSVVWFFSIFCTCNGAGY